jgi:hypothetical protein
MAQVHTLDLIKEFQKIRSSRRNNTTINYQSASEILSRLNPLNRSQAYSSQPKAECSESNIETDKGSTSEKRTRDILAPQMESCE